MSRNKMASQSADKGAHPDVSKEDSDSELLAYEQDHNMDGEQRLHFWEKQVEPTEHDRKAVVDVSRSRYPNAIVWTPLPPITWILPFIGHMGICNSEGVVFDFAGPYYIGRDNMAFGNPTRYLELDPRQAKAKPWDASVAVGCSVYEKRMHNICCDNCHSHVARCLNTMKYRGFSGWNMIILCFWVFFCAKYTGVGGFLKSWLPSLIILGIALGVYFGMH